MKYVCVFIAGYMLAIFVTWPSDKESALDWYNWCMQAELDIQFPVPAWRDQKEFCFESTANNFKDSVDVEALLYPLLK